MDIIEFENNVVKTECGHCFHTSCLMKSIAHNGFGCPYCRTEMAEVPKDDDEESEWTEIETYEDIALNGVRWMNMRLDGEEIPEDDVEEEEEEEEEPEEEVPKPSASFITQKLIERGVTMEQLVKSLLLEHAEYENESENNERASDELFGIFRIIISNFQSSQEQASNPIAC
jgi:hypothetical protein